MNSVAAAFSTALFDHLSEKAQAIYGTPEVMAAALLHDEYPFPNIQGLEILSEADVSPDAAKIQFQLTADNGTTYTRNWLFDQTSDGWKWDWSLNQPPGAEQTETLLEKAETIAAAVK